METGGNLKRTPDVEAVGAGGDGMARPTAIAAKTGVVAAASLLLGKRAMGTPGSIDIHGGGRGNAGEGAGNVGEKGFGGVGKARRGGGVGAGGGRRRLIELD